MLATDRPEAPAPLAPVTGTLRRIFGTDLVPGLAPELIVRDERGWLPATELIGGRSLDDLLAAAARRWDAQPHAAAALAWKAYTYWLALPVVLGWLSARRVPLLDPADVLVRLDEDGPLITVGLRASARIAVLPTDPLALAGAAEVLVVRDEAELLAELRRSLLDAHLEPLLAAIQDRVRVGARTLLGSVAASVAQAVLRATDTVAGSSTAAVATLLGALGVDDLIELVPGPAGAPMVQRKTCCLAFTLPRPKLCVGCCVRPS
ncbi:IucA/IucC family C-terminal-domain containing protein [Plantactinospora siamensis]|uniref:IucA/IucC family C-terminal-domain containing protein n=1 Tax=Plantactinospora siamensis TaxID=555372 RepID=A0ABV6NQC4_9ACTN